MHRRFGWLLAGVCLTVSTAAFAQEGVSGGGGGGSEGWAHAGMMGGSAIIGEAGWPGLNFEYMTSVNPSFDLGGIFTFNYGYEGNTDLTAPGIKLAADLKFLLSRQDKLSFILSFQPGFTSYFPNGYTILGASIPLRFDIGYQLQDNLALFFGAKLPLFFGVATVNGGSVSWFSIPIQFGGGMEFRVNRQLAIDFQTHFGPIIVIVDGQSATRFAFDALFGVTYHL